MLDTVLAIISLVNEIKIIAEEVDDNFTQCKRLQKRVQVFDSLLLKLKDDQVARDKLMQKRFLCTSRRRKHTVVALKKGQKTIKEEEVQGGLLLEEVKDLFADIKALIVKFSGNSLQQWASFIVFRNHYFDEIVSFNQELDRYAMLLLFNHNIDVEHRRHEDCRDVKAFIQRSTDKILKEIAATASTGSTTNSNVHVVQESLLRSLKEDMQCCLKNMQDVIDKQSQSDSPHYDMQWRASMEKMLTEIKQQVLPAVDDQHQQTMQDVLHNQQRQHEDIHLILRLVEDIRKDQRGVPHLHLEDNNSSIQVKKKKLLDTMRIPSHDLDVFATEDGLNNDCEDGDDSDGDDAFIEERVGEYHHKLVCIKRIAKQPNTRKYQAMENELIVMKYLGNHPMILTYYGFVEEARHLHVVLELSPYGSLQDLIGDHEGFISFPFALLLAWGNDMITSLKFIHSKLIKHRNIALANFFVFPNLQLKLANFGYAKQEEKSSHVVIHNTFHALMDKQSFVVKHTPVVPPESKAHQKSSFATDIFMWGIAFLHVLTRRKVVDQIDNNYQKDIDEMTALYAHKDSISVLANLLQDCLQCLQKARPDVSEVCRCLENKILKPHGDDPRHAQNKQYAKVVRVEMKLFARLQENYSRTKMDTFSFNLFTKQECFDLLEDLSQQQNVSSFLEYRGFTPDVLDEVDDMTVDDLLRWGFLNYGGNHLSNILQKLREYKQSGNSQFIRNKLEEISKYKNRSSKFMVNSPRSPFITHGTYRLAIDVSQKCMKNKYEEVNDGQQSSSPVTMDSRDQSTAPYLAPALSIPKLSRTSSASTLDLVKKTLHRTLSNSSLPLTHRNSTFSEFNSSQTFSILDDSEQSVDSPSAARVSSFFHAQAQAQAQANPKKKRTKSAPAKKEGKKVLHRTDSNSSLKFAQLTSSLRSSASNSSLINQEFELNPKHDAYNKPRKSRPNSVHVVINRGNENNLAKNSMNPDYLPPIKPNQRQQSDVFENVNNFHPTSRRVKQNFVNMERTAVKKAVVSFPKL